MAEAATNAASTKPAADGQAARGSVSADPGAIFAIVFWVVVIGAALYHYYWPNTATLALEIDRASLTVSGRVLHQGAPVPQGTLELAVTDANDDTYVARSVVDVKDGAFRAPVAAGNELMAAKRALRLKASFNGWAFKDPAARDQPDAKRIELSATEIEYVNTPPPLVPFYVTAPLAGVAVMIVLALVVLFTGVITPTKTRLLIGMMYLVTFVALVGPFALVYVAGASPSFERAMANAPVGMLKARVDGKPDAEWMVHVGAVVVPALPSAAEAGPSPGPKPMPAEAGGKRTDAPAADAVVGSASSATSPASAPQAIAPRLEGGIAVPLYMILLAMLGAAINMARRVPEIQKDYDIAVQADGKGSSVLGDLLRLLGVLQSAPGTGNVAPHEIRLNLIRNYMYIVTAPVLAVAVYYLLKALTTNGDVAKPVLVIVGFATGFISDYVVDTIIRVGKKNLGATGDAAATPPVNAPGASEAIKSRARDLTMALLLGAAREQRISVPAEEEAPAEIQPGPRSSDPWKGAFGGAAERNGRRLTASVKARADAPELFDVHLQVQPAADGAALAQGTEVTFFLHPSFPNDRIRVVATDGTARLDLVAWGAFTVGVIADDGETRLELDLAELSDAPALFKSR